ncbi:MAG TPA: MFS transporter [Alphaproteobacteria bacterium]
MGLSPLSIVTTKDIEHGKQALIHDGAWANVVGALTSGVLLVGFALELGAPDSIIGVLAAIPFVSQLAQLPAIWLVERLRRRKAITVLAATISRVTILGLAVLAFLPDAEVALGLLIPAQILICALGAVGTCAWNSWIHDLLPKEGLGDFFARRLFWATGLGMTANLLAGLLIDHAPAMLGPDGRRAAYAAVFVLGAVAGFISSYWLTRVPERAMRDSGATTRSINPVALMREPLRERNFRRLILFMASWNFATNLAAPFITVYLVQQLGFGLGFVVTLAALSQLANLATLQWWGVIADRFSNKSVLAVCAPVFLACIFALPYTHTPQTHVLTVPMLIGIHILMGGAAAGIGLATGSIGLKLAPEGQATSYLATNGLIGALAAGVAPILGGTLSEWFSDKQLSLVIHWGTSDRAAEIVAMQLRHWDFFFALAFLLGLYAVLRLQKIEEAGEVGERRVVREFMLEAQRSVRNLSTVAGLRVITRAPIGRLVTGRSEEKR